MTKFKKIAMMLILVVVMSVTTFSGCMFSPDPVKFYNAVVATVGETEITRSDLLYAYNNYGYSYYVTQQNLSPKEALNKTLEAEIDKEMLIQYCYIDDHITLTAQEDADVWAAVYNYMNGLLKGYEEKAMKFLDKPTIEAPKEDSDVEVDSAFKKYTKYAKRVKVVTKVVNSKTVTVLELIPEEKTPSGNTLVGWDNFEATIVDPEVYKKCMEYLVDDLIDAKKYLRDDNGKSYSKEPAEVMANEANEAYDRQVKYALLTKLQREYEENTIYSVSDVMNRYRELTNDSYLMYKSNESAYDTAMTGESATPENIYFHPNQKYYYLNNLLLGFSKDQETLLKAKKAQLDQNYIDEGVYNTYRDELVGNIVVRERNAKGEYVANRTISYVLDEINNIVVGSETQRANAISNLLDKYNTDPGMMNATKPYIDTKDSATYVEEFNKAGYKLDELGVYAANSGAVVTDFGVHILFYGGKVDLTTKHGYLSQANANNVTVQQLRDAVINPITGKSVLDTIFDMIYPANASENVGGVENGYSIYENKLIEMLSQKIDVKIFRSVRDASLTSVK